MPFFRCSCSVVQRMVCDSQEWTDGTVRTLPSSEWRMMVNYLKNKECWSLIINGLDSRINYKYVVEMPKRKYGIKYLFIIFSSELEITHNKNMISNGAAPSLMYIKLKMICKDFMRSMTESLTLQKMYMPTTISPFLTVYCFICN